MNVHFFGRYCQKLALRAGLSVFRLFPVKNNRIFFLNELSFSYGDNLKYLHQYLLAHKLPYEAVFALKQLPPEETPLPITVAPMTLRYFYYLLTSRVIVTNAGGVSYLPTRKQQLVINTWHGGGPYKKIGTTVNSNFWARKETEMNARNTDYILSSCMYFSQYEVPAMCMDPGKCIASGLPRNDIFFQNDRKDIQEKVRLYYRLPADARIVLYAPTFRGNFSDYAGLLGEDFIDLDFRGAVCALEKRFGGEWRFAIRLHPKLKSVSFQTDSLLNMTDYPDMQELLYAADAVITDYSSLMWDFSFTGRPCFLYAKDIEEYERTRGFYIPVAKWPYPLAHTNQELMDNILGFNAEEYGKKVQMHHKECGSFETGTACETVFSLIEQFIGANQ